MVPLSFADRSFFVCAGAGLYWPDQNALLVADLHLEKASWYARFGQMLPPYDSRATLQRLSDAMALCGARRVLCLGDNFHDNMGEARLEGQAADRLANLTATHDWTWITGNHDHGLAGRFGGTVTAQLELDDIILRHEAGSAAPESDAPPEIFGHFHPKLRLALRGRHVARPCFVRSHRRLILPAFGSLTGGMNWADPAIMAIMGNMAHALVATESRLVAIPSPAMGQESA